MLSNNDKMPSENELNLGPQSLHAAHTLARTYTPVKYSQILRTQEEASGTGQVKEAFYRGLQIIVFMRLGSRYVVASGGNECRFVSWLIHT